jgi:phosphatidylinositol-3-phosphatase
MAFSRWKQGALAVVFVLVLSIGAAVATAQPGAGKGKGDPAGGRSHKPPLDHIFVITLEDHSASGVIGDPNTPYITSLARHYGQASNYYGVTHPSEPNYLAQIAGDTFGLNHDDPDVRYSAPNLVDQLEAHGLTWGAYMESMPSIGYLGDYWPGSDRRLYASKHNPFVFFEDIRNDPDRLAKIKPFDYLAADLSSRSAPNFVYIVPNQCHDMHGGVYDPVAPDGSDGTPCPYAEVIGDEFDSQLKQKADAFVRGAIQTIMSSRAWHGGHNAIFIVADESDYNDNEDTGGWADTRGCCDSPVIPAGELYGTPTWPGGLFGGGLAPAVVITSDGPRHVVSTTPYNHYSLLTTIEDNWGLGHIGHAGHTAGGVLPMNDLIGR